MAQDVHIPYIKMNGLGNKIVIADLRAGGRIDEADVLRIAAMPDFAFDQMMVLLAPRAQGTVAFMRIYNSDGSESSACGNGTRCVGWTLAREGLPDPFLLETRAGLLSVRRQGEMFAVDMGRPRFDWQDIPLSEAFADTRAIELQVGPIDAPFVHSPSVVSMGNPHAVFWVDDVEAHDLASIGPLLEYHPLFPERANISLAQVIAPDHLLLRVWERGAGLTLACGTAACAAAVCAARTRRTARQVRVSLPGGDLFIDWQENDHVLMTGPVTFERDGFLPVETPA